MEPEHFRLSLIPAADDLPVQSGDYQRELHRVRDVLREEGMDCSLCVDWSVSGANPLYLSEVALKLAEGVGPVIGTAIGAWLHAKYGRKVRLKIGDVEAEAQTVEEVHKLLARAQEIQQRNQPKVIHEP